PGHRAPPGRVSAAEDGAVQRLRRRGRSPLHGDGPPPRLLRYDPPGSRRAEGRGVDRLPVAAPGAPLPVLDERPDGEPRELPDQHPRRLDPPPSPDEPRPDAAPQPVRARLADAPPSAGGALRPPLRVAALPRLAC